MKAIETEWKGYRFRSRLEARWAVFFEQLGLNWEYEPEGFALSDGEFYLPDFRVKTPQGLDCWYEVKPLGVTHDSKFATFCEDMERECDWQHVEAWRQSDETGEPARLPSRLRYGLLSGDPADHLRKDEICPRCGLIGPAAYDSSTYHDTMQFGCEPCDFETPCGSGNDEELGICGLGVTPHKGMLLVRLSDWQMNGLWHIECAARAARSARFEHGEKPTVRA